MAHNMTIRDIEVTIPLRLFDSFGLLTPAGLFVVAAPGVDFAGAWVERFGAGLGGPVGDELVVVADGVSRIAEGEGILISSIPNYVCIL